MNSIAGKVDHIIELKSVCKDSTNKEKEIDKLVYELYDIIKEEQRIIEDNLNF